ncbi:MAG: hypothetical protein NTX76_01460 [Alphaproteobacteria bacterium]|nr:hypothetical protein [Alphaproteobacteria bacterium]
MKRLWIAIFILCLLIGIKVILFSEPSKTKDQKPEAFPIEFASSTRYVRGGKSFGKPKIQIIVHNSGSTALAQTVLESLPSDAAIVVESIDLDTIKRIKDQGNALLLSLPNGSDISEKQLREWYQDLRGSLFGFMIAGPFLRDAATLQKITLFCKQNGLALFFSEPGRQMSLFCHDNGIRCYGGDMAINPTDTLEIAKKKLGATVDLAQKQGYSVITISILTKEFSTLFFGWLGSLNGKGVELISFKNTQGEIK